MSPLVIGFAAAAGYVGVWALMLALARTAAHDEDTLDVSPQDWEW